MEISALPTLRIALVGDVNVEIWDVGGQSLTSKSSTNYIHAVDAILLVYDITHIGSLRGLEEWIKSIYVCMSMTNSHVPMIVLVANKMDLSSSRAVKPERHTSFSISHNTPSFHISAASKTGIEGLNEMFQRMAMGLCGIRALTVESTMVMRPRAISVGVSIIGPSSSTRKDTGMLELDEEDGRVFPGSPASAGAGGFPARLAPLAFRESVAEKRCNVM
ncbi:Ras- protein Rab-28 [Podochytrium sp. JEL0797]|nr:Ras- protein Rab-28 [Podochytrium sp. JEL0797]